jgi:glutamate-ammonia-ligase adenylyltransferase
MPERAFACTDLPLPYDVERAARALERLAEAGFTPGAEHRDLLTAAFGNSPYLARLAPHEPQFLRTLLDEGPDRAMAALVAGMPAHAAADSMAAIMSGLRVAKRRMSLAVALADICGVWTLAEVTGALSRFADSCVGTALRFLLRIAAAETSLASLSAEQLEAETGLVVLAMGKYGACELNYSSDIDLIVFYEAERFPFRKRDDPRAAAVDIVKGLVKLLSEVTAEGYVFRVDLRLRPDAGATQVAISTEAAEAYYEAMGQNWERAALIKTRACAGDRAAAAEFLKAIAPFVWRRHLDYAAIEDIHSIKRQIHAHEGHGEIAVAGHNVKLGRGGIREIEFFVQTQQLILGGRDPNLRAPSTLEALRALEGRGLVSGEAADELCRAYEFLRRLEHRLQMIEDQQTHTIPEAAEDLEHIARFMGFPSAEAFAQAVTAHLETVQRHYVHLFEQAPPLAGEAGSLVFTGVEDDPETLQTLSALGFSDPHHIAHAVRGWHHGRIRATRSARARELLTKLVPPLLQALSQTADPDSAFAQFDRFVSRLPAGVQPFSLLAANPQLLRLIAGVCGAAPRFADRLAQSPELLDAILDTDFLAALPSSSALEELLAAQLKNAADYERKLDAVRRFARERNFQIAVQLLEGMVRADGAAAGFTAVAEAVIRALVPAVAEEFANTAGDVDGGQFAVIAMGRLGGREMTAASDLDLIFVYELPSGVELSSGPKRLPASLFYGRLAQRLIAALTAHTAEGGLYEVDMRLRPTGNKGPVAVSLESFTQYHAEQSWTWERMALMRARVICGPPRLRARIEAAITASLAAPRDPQTLKRDAREMREKLAAQFPAKSSWDLKFAAGGLVDIEFAAQYLQLREGPVHPTVLAVSTLDALERLHTAGALAESAACALADAGRLQQSLLQALRIAVEGGFEPENCSSGLKRLLARSVDVEGFEEVERRLRSAQSAARRAYEQLLCS